MSYDLMVFEKGRAPAGKADFLNWYQEQKSVNRDKEGFL